MNNDDFNMQPNNNLNLNNQNNVDSNPGNQILMGDTTQIDNLNQNMQPINNNQEVSPQQPEPIQNVQPESVNVQPEVSQTVDPQTVLSSNVEPPQQETNKNPGLENNLNQQPNPQMDQIQTLNQSSENVNTIFSDTPTETPKQKNGSGLKVLIIILVLAILGVGGYFAYDKFFANKSTPAPTPAPTPVAKKVLLKDDSKEVVYSNVDEMHNGIIRRIPAVNINSKYADEINNELKSMLSEGYLEGQLKEAALEYVVDYQYYINDEIVSLKFSWETEGTETHTKIYNINQYTGEKVTNDEIMSLANISSTELGNKLVETYKSARPFETIENNGIWKDSYDKDIETLQNATIKGMYLNNKELYVLFDMHSPAGAGIGEALLNVTSSKLTQNPVKMQ